MAGWHVCGAHRAGGISPDRRSGGLHQGAFKNWDARNREADERCECVAAGVGGVHAAASRVREAYRGNYEVVRMATEPGKLLQQGISPGCANRRDVVQSPKSR